MATTVVLTLVGAGAVSAQPPVELPEGKPGSSDAATHAGAPSGSTVMASAAARTDRERAVSRDSQREALRDAADAQLQRAAEAQARERNAALAQLAASAEQHAAKLASEEWVLPLRRDYRITARFGHSSSLWASTHTGLDFAVPAGTPIVSVASGRVTSTGYDGAYGYKTVVTLEDGTEVWYCHQASFAVRRGDQVRSGQVLGTVGSTGNSTGPHLHLEIRPGAGDPVDPYAALVVRGLRP